VGNVILRIAWLVALAVMVGHFTWRVRARGPTERLL